MKKNNAEKVHKMLASHNKEKVIKRYPKAHCMFYQALRVGESDHFRIYDSELSDAFIIGGGTSEDVAWGMAAFQLPSDK